MLPNMKRTIKRFEKPVTYVQNIIIDSSGFGNVTDPVELQIKAVVQIPKDETLTALALDYSKNYRQLHFTTNYGFIPATERDGIKYNNKNYKVIQFRDFEEYGYYEIIVEELLNGGY